MSVVSAKVYNDKIVMAADSQVTRYGQYKDTTGNFSKLQRVNDVIIGVSGNVEECSFLWHYMGTHKPAGNSVKDILDYMIEFSRWKKELTGSSSVNNTCLIAFGGKLFVVYGITVMEVKDFDSVGCGYMYANAAMHLGHTPREAVKVACDLDCFVGEPIIEEVMLK